VGGNQGTKEQFTSNLCLHCQNNLFVAPLHPNVLAFHAVDVAFLRRLSKKGQCRRQNSNQLVFACHVQNPAQIYQLCAAPDSIHFNQVNNQGASALYAGVYKATASQKCLGNRTLHTESPCAFGFFDIFWNDRMRKRGFAIFCLETPFCSRARLESFDDGTPRVSMPS